MTPEREMLVRAVNHIVEYRRWNYRRVVDGAPFFVAAFAPWLDLWQRWKEQRARKSLAAYDAAHKEKPDA